MLICLRVFLKLKCGRLALVDEIRVEDVELVALNNLGGRVVMVIVRLVVLVPLVARVDPVEVLGLARPVLVMPPVHLHQTAFLLRRYHFNKQRSQSMAVASGPTLQVDT